MGRVLHVRELGCPPHVEHHLGDRVLPDSPSALGSDPATVRVLSYNIRHGQGVGGVISNKRIARVVRALDCDLAGLNEVWRTRGYDQPMSLGGLTGMSAAFHSLEQRWGREIGNLALARGGFEAVREIKLGGRREERGCLVAEVAARATVLTFAVTHLSLHRSTREQQLERLAEELPSDRPLILVGDFNCGVTELGPLSERLRFPIEVPPTYPSVRPFRALDHIGFSRHWALDSLGAVPSWASDHLPLVASLRLSTT